MQIVHVIEPFASGVTTAAIHITKELTEMEHVVIHGKRSWVDPVETMRSRFPETVRFHLWKFAGREINPLKDLLALVVLIYLLRHYRAGIIHLHSSKAGFLGRIACRILGIKRVIYTPHCASFMRTDISEKKRDFYKNLEILADKFGGRIVGCGRTEAEQYTALGLVATHISNGIEPAEEKDREEKKEVIVSFVGIANEQKNPGAFNHIARNVDKMHNARFIWVGDGDLRTCLEEPFVQTTGWVDKDQVAAYLEKSLVFLSTSRWEGLSYSVLEAMNASCALLLHDIPGNRELVEQGRNGYLFSSEEEATARLNELLSDLENTRRMGRESYKLVKECFNVHSMGEEYRKLYTELMKA